MLAYSCKPPVPVYFDKPIGIKIQGFDTTLAGNYFPLDDILDKSIHEFSEKYEIRYDKIIFKNKNSIKPNEKEINYDEIKELIGKDSSKEKKEIKCDSSLAKFNKLAVDKMESEKSAHDVAGIIKIMYDKAIAISVDSAGVNHYDTLAKLDMNTVLTKYSGKYFLNFKTPFGWEILQMETWEEKFLSVRPFYFTSYDNCAQTVAALTASTKNIYPGLNPVVLDKKVIGFRASMNPKLILEAFKKSESPMLLMRVK
ncbi:MAG: hypothetical protein HY063_02850 [Bacteroidetes bacterium]|nr:hypothetical protein [Bacteroidota bacterium]